MQARVIDGGSPSEVLDDLITRAPLVPRATLEGLVTLRESHAMLMRTDAARTRTRLLPIPITALQAVAELLSHTPQVRTRTRDGACVRS